MNKELPQTETQVILGGVDHSGISGTELTRVICPLRDQSYYDSIEWNLS